MADAKIRSFAIAVFFLSLQAFAQLAPTVTSTPSSRSTSKLTISGGKSIHLSCNKSIRNLKTNKVECIGNVYLRRPGELMTADYAVLDMNTEDLHAEGNVVYFAGQNVIYGAKMDFNFNTDTGVIEDGRIESDRYELLGEYIEKYSDDEFYLKDADYTTCRDCPASWRLAAKTVDFRVEGYALMGNVYVKVNESPTLYLPGMIIPVKTRRQTGFLFPKFGTSQTNGFMFVQPLYWAISRSTDATLGYGTYTNRGRKGEGEFRFQSSPRTKGQMNAFYLKDRQFPINDYQDRWAVNYTHNVVLPWKIEQKLTLLNASDRDYARVFPGDIPGFGEPALVSDAGLSRAGRDASVWVDAKYIRNNLTGDLVGFDRNTVQVLPSVSVATVDHRVSDQVPLHWGISGKYTKFWRKGPSFDPIYENGPNTLRSDFIPGLTPIRKTERYSVVPEMYYTARAWDVFELVPSVQYRSFFYKFDTELSPTTTRGYLLSQVEMATTVEKMYSPKLKHKMRPSIIYSIIPVVNRDTAHPFVKQLETSGNQFDDNDIVPLTNENQLYFVPLGNSVSYQLSNKFVTKNTSVSGTQYESSVDVTSGQSYNFYELRKEQGRRRPLSRFYTLVGVHTMRVQSNAEYFFYPYINGSTYNVSSNYIFAQYFRRLLRFQRSVGLSYSYNQITSRSNNVAGNFTYSINDYFMVNGGISYELPMRLSAVENGKTDPKVLSVNGGLTYQSPSQCYRLVLGATKVYRQGWGVQFDVPINLSGNSFNNIVGGGAAGGGGSSPIGQGSI